MQAPAEDCGHAEVIMALQDRLSETESMNTALRMHNEELQDRLTQAYSEWLDQNVILSLCVGATSTSLSVRAAVCSKVGATPTQGTRITN